MVRFDRSFPLVNGTVAGTRESGPDLSADSNVPPKMDSHRTSNGEAPHVRQRSSKGTLGVRLFVGTLLFLGTALAFGYPAIREPSPRPSVPTKPPVSAASPNASPAQSEVSPEPSIAVSLAPVTELVYRVPTRIRESCSSVDNVGVEGEIETIACSEQSTWVFYSRFPTLEAMDSAYDRWVGVAAPPTDSLGCKAGEPIQGTWYYTNTPTSVEGRMFCYYAFGSVPWTIWTQPSTRILGYASSNDLDLAAHHLRWQTLLPIPMR